MFASFTSTLLLLASAVVAQTQTPSVVTFISITPTPASEQIFSIQPIIPSFVTTACYEVCIMPPCNPCGVTSSVSGSMGIPQGETPIPSSLLSSAASGSMGIPQGETPIPSSLVSISVSGSMGIPQGETPIPTSLLSSTPGPVLTSGPTPSGTSIISRTPSPTRSAPAQQSTAAASPSLRGDSAPVKLALVISGLALFGATLIVL